MCHLTVIKATAWEQLHWKYMQKFTKSCMFELTDDSELSVGEDSAMLVLCHTLVHADVCQIQAADCQHSIIRLNPVLLKTCAHTNTNTHAYTHWSHSGICCANLTANIKQVQTRWAVSGRLEWIPLVQKCAPAEPPIYIQLGPRLCWDCCMLLKILTRG